MPKSPPGPSDIEAVHTILEAMASRPDLHGEYVLKGGLALWLAYGSPRRSSDLDFNAVAPTANVITDESTGMLLEFCRRLDASLAEVVPTSSIQWIETRDIEISTEIPALLGQVAYSTTTGTQGSVAMQMTLSEIICSAQVRKSRGIPIHVASLDDIIAEKLKALLQQITRNSVRSTDVFDLWYFTSRSKERVRPEDVTEILLEKRKQWPRMPTLSKAQYRHDRVIEQATSEYDALIDLIEPDGEFVPFTEAYGAILGFVDQLMLPD